MAETSYEYHNDIEEFFPMHETVKGRKKFSRKTSGASGIMATASAGIIAAAVTLLLLFCSTTAVGTSSVTFRTTVCNANDSTQIYYYVIPYETVSQNAEMDHILHGRNTGPDTEDIFMRNAVASGPVSSGTDTFQVDGLESNTRYVIVFFDRNPDGVRFLNALEFRTRGPSSEPPAPEETIPAPPQEENSTEAETIPETVPETVPETTEETEPEPTEAPTLPPVYIQPPKEEPTTPPPTETVPPPTETVPPPTETVPPPTETVPPPTETVPPEEIPQGNEITVEGPILWGGRTKYRISTTMDMKGYEVVGVEIRLGNNSVGNDVDGIYWDPNENPVTVSGEVYLETATSVQIVVYYNRNGVLAEVSSAPAVLALYDGNDDGVPEM